MEVLKGGNCGVVKKGENYELLREGSHIVFKGTKLLRFKERMLLNCSGKKIHWFEKRRDTTKIYGNENL